MFFKITMIERGIYVVSNIKNFISDNIINCIKKYKIKKTEL